MKNTAPAEKVLIAALKGHRGDRVPFWLMRQAGRYLPEYRDLRAKAGGFLDMVYNPNFAIEVTMQPLRRYGMDAAILFSDILVIPQALGQDLTFVEGEGPKLAPVRTMEDLARLSFDEDVLKPVYESVAGIRTTMEKEGFGDAALIGFAGAPWTVATYMVEGRSSRDMIHVKQWAYRDPDHFQKLIDKISDATFHYLVQQVESGAEALQLFDSWAGVLDAQQYRRWVIEPARKITAALHEKFPHVPLIGFPRGSGVMYRDYAAQSGMDVIGLDPQLPLEEAAELQKNLPVQGNLDPVCLLGGGDALKHSAEQILRALSGGPFVFNLGHGVIKDTPPEHVEQLATIIKNWRS